jgi:hypothetical protein
MPHLITIIKYACNIVKYLLVLLSALFQKAAMASCNNSTSGSFCSGWRPKWLRFVNLRKGLTGMVAACWDRPGGLSYFEREHWGGAAPDIK